MPASEILRIVVTVATVQFLCDLVAHWRIFSQQSYQRQLEKLSRAKFKLDQIQEKEGITHETVKAAAAAATTTTNSKSKKNNNSKADRNAKKLQRAEDDHKNALADITKRHTVPNFFTSIVFLILMRVMGTELKGKVLAVLPFAPFGIFKRITSRGLDFTDGAADVFALMATSGDGKEEAGRNSSVVTDLAQACSFAFLYMLTAMSVKFYVHQLFGTKPPPGAESLLSLVDSPQGKNMIRAVGLEPVDLKEE
jgi:Integral membrane protein EMC3/TMCO1-like